MDWRGVTAASLDSNGMILKRQRKQKMQLELKKEIAIGVWHHILEEAIDER